MIIERPLTSIAEAPVSTDSTPDVVLPDEVYAIVVHGSLVTLPV
jgi:G:T-mismatch repair DNA endonuclease (very short patch repair protein)